MQSSSMFGSHAVYRCLVYCALIILVDGTLLDAADSRKERSTEAKIAAVMAEVLRQPYQSMDVLFYKTETRPPKSIEQIRQTVDAAYKATDDISTTKGDPIARNKELEDEVQRISRKQHQPRIVKQRIRTWKHFYRLDQAVAEAGEELDAETEFQRTFINYGDRRNGEYDNFEYEYPRKIATRDDKRTSMWKTERVWRAGKIGLGTVAIFTATLARAQQVGGTTMVVPNPEAMHALAAGTNETIQISFSSIDYKSRPAERMEIRFREHSENKATVAIFDRDDYSRVYRDETYDPRTGKLVALAESDDFDSHGFPTSWRTERYLPDGTHIDEYAFAEVNIDVPLSEDVFAFSPPADFSIVDRRPETPVVTQTGQSKIASVPRDAPATWSRWSIVVTLNCIAVMLVVAFVIHRRRTRSRAVK